MQLSIPGIDAARGLQQAGNCPALYIHFLKRFPSDPSFQALGQSLDTGRIDSAFLHAHTFKGLTLQLGIFALSTPAAALSELLRSKDPAVLPDAREHLRVMEPIYREITARIRLLS